MKAILAGMMIAFGASGSSVAAHDIVNVGIARLVAGVVFPMGLMMVVMTGAELFTGDCLAIMATVQKKHTALAYTNACRSIFWQSSWLVNAYMY